MIKIIFVNSFFSLFYFKKAGMTLTYDPTTAALQNGYVK